MRRLEWPCREVHVGMGYSGPAGSGHCGESSKHLRKFRVGTLNVNALRGRVCEVFEILSHRKVDICCIQETIYCGGNCRTIKGKDSRYKSTGLGTTKALLV